MALDPTSAEYRIGYARAQEREVNVHLARAERALVELRYDEAEAAYRRALARQPGNERALSGLRLIDTARRHETLYKEAEIAWAKQDAEGAKGRLRTILAANAKHERALALQRVIDENTVKTGKESVLAAAFRKPITIEFRDTPLKTVFEVISRTSGLNFVFDKDLRADQKTTIFLRNSTIEAAINVLLLTNQLEQRVLDGNTILIYPNTPAKQKEYQALVVKTYYLANSDAKTVGTTLKTILKTRDIVVDEKLNMLMIRDSLEAVRMADKLVALQDIPEPEVMLEVEILEVKRTRLQALGINWPDNIALRALPVDGLTLKQLSNITSETTGVTVGPVIIRANQTDSDVNLLANPRIRARNREKAKILIGDRVPNITSTITATGFSSESITYIDVGLKLDFEPTIYLDNEVALKVVLEVSNIVDKVTTKTGTVAYQIGTRTASSVLRLKDGENQLLAGLISDEDRRNSSKLPYLGDIPILGRLFGSHSGEGIKTEIVLSITPRILRNIQRAELYLAEFDGGTETSFRGRPESNAGSQALGAQAPGARPAALPSTPAISSGPGVAAPGMQNSPISSSTPGSLQPGTAVNPQANPLLPSQEGYVPQPEAALSGVGQAGVQSVGAVQLLWQGPTQLKAGDTIALQLVMQADRPVVSVPLAIGFDPRLLQVADVREGAFLRQGGAATTFSYRVDPGGQVLLTATRSGAGGATSPDTLATLTFRALAAGTSRVELITIAPIGSGGSTINAIVPAAHALTINP
ncbi:MAG: secretin and TonB N-terminal domain-containing protein [Candidatus Accumulibacter sp.]|uniref:Secretin and TonB N-terminal domain-containing protein n=1 Tax=Candidatus Accumulibacter affinis TaxID=2954384 RepID=A0A935W2L6_9PROT|nr:secretin and TonB N-terminal domain-containing protein [Candidatus Accumulibacter affinis]